MAKKTKEELLAAYKKASKPARLVIIGRAGCISEAQYFKYLDTLAVPVADSDGMLDMVIAFDTTGSMASYINSVKAHVKDLIPKLFADNKNLRLKIVAFGDYCDVPAGTQSLSGDLGKAYQQVELTNDENTLISFVQNAKNTSGGDSDEFYELVMKKVLDETAWRKDAKKSVLLIGDCEPHKVGYSYNSIVRNNKIDWEEEAKRSSEMGVTWDTLTCGTYAVESFYKPLSKMTNGISIPFRSAGKTQEIVAAATSVRGSTVSKAAFRTAYTSAVASGDAELIGSYKSLSELL